MDAFTFGQFAYSRGFDLNESEREYLNELLANDANAAEYRRGVDSKALGYSEDN